MSSESKKKRGEAGQANARANAFRINGWPMDWQARRIGALGVPASRSSGSTTMRGFIGGLLAQTMGYPIAGHENLYELMLEHAAKRVTHPLLKE